MTEAPTENQPGPPYGYRPPPGYGYGPPPGYGYGPPPGYGPSPVSGPPPWRPAPDRPGIEVPDQQRQRGRLSAFLRNFVVAWTVAAVLAIAVVGLSVAVATAGTNPSRHAPSSARPGFFGGGFANLGVFGTVTGVGSHSFTLTTRSGQTVSVDEQSSTTYYNGPAITTSSAVVNGAAVAVQGARSGDTVKAARVEVLPSGGFGTGFSG